MKFYEFLSLSARDQAQFLWDDGEPVARREASDRQYVLYQLSGFYVEVEYRTDFAEMVQMRAYETGDLPEVYLSSINLGELGH